MEVVTAAGTVEGTGTGVTGTRGGKRQSVSWVMDIVEVTEEDMEGTEVDTAVKRGEEGIRDREAGRKVAEERTTSRRELLM